ncbi:hypothetical protein AAT17_03630 [Nonlabens sp. MIC269]|uniref:hypothetical protein n=1 Tax=Nonlabens sp. MIC269 TaxID=1476901 RepID=UPI00071F79B5|nr:hypothetical protein [Nonlabens sp. MIC269]ALM20385.1 hypothetical protein AAT17_03630 [Nonlabens sp. MIC269]
MIKKITLVVLIAFISSCYSTQELSKRTSTDIMYFNKNTFEAEYQNRVPGDTQNSLWKDLCFHDNSKNQIGSTLSTVGLKMEGDNRIKAVLYENKIPQDSLILKGKLKDKLFVIRKGSYVIPLIFVNGSRTKKTALGNDINGDLVLLQKDAESSAILGEEGHSQADFVTATYMRIN